MLLTWMQEKKEDVMLFATANSIDSLPPELLRAGRIDATFYVDLPDEVQRKEIFKIHLRKAVGASFPNGRDPEMFNEHLPELMRLCDNFTGAEIEVWIKEAITRAYNVGHADIQVEDLRGAINEVTPIYRLQGDEIRASRNKARERGTKLAAGSWDRPTSAVPSQAPVARMVSVDNTDTPPN
jgi:SpoVK/Ycf46/Vps4 family AAA+-type ATPase